MINDVVQFAVLLARHVEYILHRRHEMTHASFTHMTNKSAPVIEVRIMANVSSVNIVLSNCQRVLDRKKKREMPYVSKFLYEE